MTAQAPDELINNCPQVNIDGYRLYFILEDKNGRPGDRGIQLPERTLDSKDRIPSTDCYRGYVATFEITPEASVVLRSYAFHNPFDRYTAGPLDVRPPSPVQVVNEALTGNFWLKLKPKFFSSNELYIPVKNGKLETDSNQWIRSPREKKTAEREMTSKESRSIFAVIAGLFRRSG